MKRGFRRLGPFVEDIFKEGAVNEFMSDMKMAKGQGELGETKTGAKRERNDGRGRFDLLPYEGLEELAKWYEAGAEKYGDRNWEKGLEVQDCTNRMVRHSIKAANGWMDEGPFAHYAAVAWNAIAAITLIKRFPYLNNHFHDEYLKELGLTDTIPDPSNKLDILNKGISNLEELTNVTPFVGYTDPSVVPTGVGDHLPAHAPTAQKFSWEHDITRLMTDKASEIRVAILNNRLLVSCDFNNGEDLEEFRANLARMGIETTGGNHDIPTDGGFVRADRKDQGAKEG